jgi:hypothetical protein
MSHRMLGSIMLSHIPSLRKAVMKDERLEWVEGATGYSYYYDSPDSRKCSHKIKVKDSHYEIGVVEDTGGKGYRLEWESDANFGGIIGSKGEILATAYAKEYTRDWAAKNGFVISESVDKEGSIVLTMTN